MEEFFLGKKLAPEPTFCIAISFLSIINFCAFYDLLAAEVEDKEAALFCHPSGIAFLSQKPPRLPIILTLLLLDDCRLPACCRCRCKQVCELSKRQNQQQSVPALGQERHGGEQGRGPALQVLYIFPPFF